MKVENDAKIEGDGTTSHLCAWLHDLQPADVPSEVVERAKYLILDGIGCALVGAHLPHSEQLADAIRLFEPKGACRVIGYQNDCYGPLAAAILNGAFIQATELDDYHSVAPLHSASVLLPALFAASDCQIRQSPITGTEFLLAAIAGFETGPRVGNAIYGSDLLTRGWHSGPVFGSPAAATATSKLLNLAPSDTESAIGIACTQAGGLMSAQFEGMIKRVQHAFAARNGLFGALIARTGYVGIKKVFERPYGGFLAMFAAGNSRNPPFRIHEVIADLGSVWHTAQIRVKLHACVGGCHGLIECLAKIQATYPHRLTSAALSHITKITVGLSGPIFAHDGWLPEERPLTSTGAQMNAAYIGALQLVDRQVLLAQFATETLDRDEVWDLVYKTTCYHCPEFDKPNLGCGAKVRLEFADGDFLEDKVEMPKGFEPPVTNEEIKQKWRRLASSVISDRQAQNVEELVLGMEELDDVRDLTQLLAESMQA